MNNTACTALFLPIGLVLARFAGWAPSKVLMPVAFASILGGSLTLVGPSTNVIVGQLLPLYGQPTLGMFELTPVALPIALVGLGYLFLVSSALLPAREGSDSLADLYSLREYVTEVALRPESPLVGTRLADADLRSHWDLSLLAVVRRGEPLAPSPEVTFEGGDLLLVQGEAKTLLGLRGSRGFIVHQDAEALPAAVAGDDLALAEAVVQPRSDLLGRTLGELDFRQRFGANVLAITRGGQAQLSTGDKVNTSMPRKCDAG
jgi:K+/H+ antiporter YhaU regulatory subunit KhtT